MQDVVEVPSTGVSHDNDDVVVDDADGGVLLLSANTHRKSALIINTGAGIMRVTTDGSAPTPTRGKQLVPGAALTLSSPYAPVNEVRACQQGTVSTTANASEVD